MSLTLILRQEIDNTVLGGGGSICRHAGIPKKTPFFFFFGDSFLIPQCSPQFSFNQGWTRGTCHYFIPNVLLKEDFYTFRFHIMKTVSLWP